ncbi:MAG: pyruvate dehydrogenase complex dihydrolipoamide acetyltransferase [Owenweeksia sp.]|nr:pyruvate dehydrogenase complex dihydrolipoamide acetyltransferase [Owenweeksia sp.]
MAEVVTMPRLSDTMEEGTVAKWHKKVGEQVSEGDLLAEIETDKATMDFEAFQEGTLLHIGIDEGETAPVDSILAVLGEEGEDISSILEGGDNQEKNADQKSEKTEEQASQETSEKSSSDQKPVEASASKTTEGGRIKASPLAKKLAEEKKVDLAQVSGSGEGGRIVKRDIDEFEPSAAASSAAALIGGEAGYEEVAVSQMRKTIAKRLAESKFTAPHFYLTLAIDMDHAIAARKSVNEISETKISFNDMVIKAVAAALQKHPKVNSSWLGDKIRYNKDVHIGVAVAVEEGLLVPVVRHADRKGLATINTEVKEAAAKARDKKLQPADWEGNTFTISNLGMFGIEEFTAIINSPDSCILAIGGIRQVPVVKDGQVVPGNVMKVTLSCDHRVVDGATGAAFLQSVKANLETPLGMLV